MLGEIFGSKSEEEQMPEVIEVYEVQPKENWKWISVSEHGGIRLSDNESYSYLRDFVNSEKYHIHVMKMLYDARKKEKFYHIWFEEKETEK
ncbi:hypothetical protein CN495_08475 [Bacillus thuringiensis]|uniref:Uncharacterized protein n=1 Tax=Bacillus thuringiensis TaxID=1428 RepID=A0ABD6S7G1_BACTU|nr:hypothetical protein [Bacillus thuringiensis]PER55778.1 hypothetical protein CN495_08475 [Bacillus thuringiensis]